LRVLSGSRVLTLVEKFQALYASGDPLNRRAVQGRHRGEVVFVLLRGNEGVEWRSGGHEGEQKKEREEHDP